MPPRRPLPDLVLITTFKMLTANDQMVASLTSPRCAVLVRAANRTVKRLAIIKLHLSYNPKYIKEDINSMSLASEPAMQQLMDICGGEPSFPHYPLITTPLNPWNVLQLGHFRLPLDTATTIEQITAVFSAVTNLIFITTVLNKDGMDLASFLRHPNWQCQLTNLVMDGVCPRDSQLTCALITAINGLTALQQMTLNWYRDADLPDLTILAQLKMVAFSLHNLHPFLRSLERHATNNADLQVHLFSEDTEGLLSLSQPLHCSRIVHFGHDEHFLLLSDATRLCSQFRSLTSLNINFIHLTEIGPLFTALSQLHQLILLVLVVNPDDDEEEELPPPPSPLPPRPLAQMNSLRALELYLSITSHSEIKWLNLPVTMPNLQTIYSQEFRCASCKVEFYGWRSSSLPLLNSPSALHCFQSSLFTLHFGVPMNRFILRLPVEKSMSAEKLLLQSASEPVTTGQP